MWDGESGQKERDDGSTPARGFASLNFTSVIMPTYEYVCSKCGHEFEKFQPIADKALNVCPANLCAKKKWGRGAVKRKISSGAGLIFKGSGFYITDYRSEGYKEAAKKESDATKPAAEDSKPSKSADAAAKPVAKSESKTAKASSPKT
jgi:putative FmdB family regulatory protein